MSRCLEATQLLNVKPWPSAGHNIQPIANLSWKAKQLSDITRSRHPGLRNQQSQLLRQSLLIPASVPQDILACMRSKHVHFIPRFSHMHMDKPPSSHTCDRHTKLPISLRPLLPPTIYDNISPSSSTLPNKLDSQLALRCDQCGKCTPCRLNITPLLVKSSRLLQLRSDSCPTATVAAWINRSMDLKHGLPQEPHLLSRW
jgi:hypothetical protein